MEILVSCAAAGSVNVVACYRGFNSTCMPRHTLLWSGGHYKTDILWDRAQAFIIIKCFVCMCAFSGIHCHHRGAVSPSVPGTG